MNLTIRKATPSDASSIHTLIHKLAQFEHMESSFTLTIQRLEEVLKNQRMEAFIAIHDTRVVGVALYYVIFTTFMGADVLKLEDLYVEEDQRHQGIAQKLMQALAKEAQAKGYDALSWSCLTWNTPALMLYHRLDAKIVPDWLHFKLDRASLTKLAHAKAPSKRSSS